MIYDITGGIDKGIHYTRFIEKVEGDDPQGESMQPNEEKVKSHGFILEYGERDDSESTEQ